MVILLPPPKSLYSFDAFSVGDQSSGSGCQNQSCCGISSHCKYLGSPSSSTSIGVSESYWGRTLTCSMVIGSSNGGSMVPSISSTGSGLYLRGRPRRRFGLSSPSGGSGFLRGRPRRFPTGLSSASTGFTLEVSVSSCLAGSFSFLEVELSVWEVFRESSSTGSTLGCGSSYSSESAFDSLRMS